MSSRLLFAGFRGTESRGWRVEGRPWYALSGGLHVLAPIWSGPPMCRAASAQPSHEPLALAQTACLRPLSAFFNVPCVDASFLTVCDNVSLHVIIYARLSDQKPAWLTALTSVFCRPIVASGTACSCCQTRKTALSEAMFGTVPT